jgi:hypothetical protein
MGLFGSAQVAVKEVNLMPSADDVSLVPDADMVGTRDGIWVDERAENIGSLLLASPDADIIKVESPRRTTGLFAGRWQ